MQTIHNKPLSMVWLKASVVGSIWASIEIILGSFLHNMRVPVSGMILSFIGVWLLVSFVQVWKEKGLIWRAGLICALMKSISPSAIIMGPMIGIFTEALLIELFIFLLGKNILGYLIGGAFAVLSTLMHKLVSLLILYGFDFLKILYDIYLFGVKQIGMEQLSPVYMLVTITAIYMALGMTGAVGGLLTARRYLKTRDEAGRAFNIVLQPGNQLFNQSPGHNYSLILLLLNLIAIIVILLLINFNRVIPASVAALTYIALCIIHYRNSLKRFKKISFWLTFLIITFAAAFLWNGFSNGAFFTFNGLMVGLKMNARAIIIILGFASISVELKNPVIKSILYHRGFASLYQSLSMAFSALPFIISNISRPGNGQKRVMRISKLGLFSQAEAILQIFAREHEKRPEVVIITGEVHQGKTTFAKKVVDRLLEQNVKIGGFLAPAINKEGKRVGFDLLDIETSEKYELCSDKNGADRYKFGHYYFDNETILKGIDILSTENTADKQIIVIDEVGPVELSGKGWNGAIENICRNNTVLMIWIVRKNILRKVVRKWNIGNAYIFDINEDTEAEVEARIKDLIS